MQDGLSWMFRTRLKTSRKLRSRFCSVSRPRILGYANSSGGVSASILDCCISRVTFHSLHAISPEDGLYIRLYATFSRNVPEVVSDLLYVLPFLFNVIVFPFRVRQLIFKKIND